MPTVNSSHAGAMHESGRRRVKPLLYALVILGVFVATVVIMAVKDGTSAAVVTAFLAFMIAGTALGLVGAVMAVKETDLPESRPADELARPVPVGSARTAP